MDWTQIYTQYPGKWVALDPADEQTVVASGARARTVYKNAVSKGYKDAILHFVARELVSFVGHEISL